MMSKGITLIAIGGYGYLKWAVNMACSIKHHSPGVAIQLITAEEGPGKTAMVDDAKSLPQLFDFVTIIPKEAFHDSEGRLFPAKLKTDLYRHLIFDETIYLDVDGCIMKDITPLFNQQEDFVTDVQGVYDLSMGEEFDALKWAKPPVIWSHFGLNPTDKLPAINSSFLFIRKSKKIESVFTLAHELLNVIPLPYEKHWHVWGHRREYKINQPDELYMNVAMAKLGIIPANEVAIYFRLANERGPQLTAGEVMLKYYGIGLFGQLESNHRSCRDIYDNHMIQVWRSKMKAPFYNDSYSLSKYKFAVA